MLIKNNINFSEGTTWTIDAPYRETTKEINKYKKEGIATVEMEAAALFAVTRYRKLKSAAIFSISDVLGEKWEPKFNTKEHKVDIMAIIKAIVNNTI
jgi:purine-nucleoside phosphorylase